MICSEPKKVIDFTIRCQISLLTDSIDPTIQINFEKNETILLNKSKLYKNIFFINKLYFFNKLLKIFWLMKKMNQSKMANFYY